MREAFFVLLGWGLRKVERINRDTTRGMEAETADQEITAEGNKNGREGESKKNLDRIGF